MSSICSYPDNVLECLKELNFGKLTFEQLVQVLSQPITKPLGFFSTAAKPDKLPAETKRQKNKV